MAESISYCPAKFLGVYFFLNDEKDEGGQGLFSELGSLSLSGLCRSSAPNRIPPMSSQGSMSNEDLSLLEKYGDLSLDDEGMGTTWGEGLEIANNMTMDLFPLPLAHLEEMDALAPGTYLPAVPGSSLPAGPQSAAAAAKLEWQRAIIEDELSRPLEVPEDFIQELAAREAEVEASVMRDLKMHVAAVATLKEKLYEKSEASQQTLLSSAQRLDNIASLAAAGLVPQESVNAVATRAANALAVREVGLHESMLRLQQLEARISQLEGRTSGAALASALGVPLPGGGGEGLLPPPPWVGHAAPWHPPSNSSTMPRRVVVVGWPLAGWALPLL